MTNSDIIDVSFLIDPGTYNLTTKEDIFLKKINVDKVHVCKQLSIFFNKKFKSHSNALF